MIKMSLKNLLKAKRDLVLKYQNTQNIENWELDNDEFMKNDLELCKKNVLKLKDNCFELKLEWINIIENIKKLQKSTSSASILSAPAVASTSAKPSTSSAAASASSATTFTSSAAASTSSVKPNDKKKGKAMKRTLGTAKKVKLKKHTP
jgi:hypothetical protein